MKKTPFFEIHNQLGAKMSLFGGYQMPIHYSGVQQEHLAVRNNLGVFDISHMGEFLIEGPNALDLIQSVCSNDASVLTIGKAQYSCIPNAVGGIVDDLIIYRIKEETYLLVRDLFALEEVGEIKLKGISRPVKYYEVISEQTEEAERLIIDTSHLKIELNQTSFGKEDLLNLENVYLKMKHIMNEAENSTDK